MFDFIKGEILNVSVEELKSNELLDFHRRVNENTGDFEESDLIANYEGIKFTIKARTGKIFIQGSLPKYFFGNNYQNLTFTNFKEVMCKLKEQFGIDPKALMLQNIEFGVCVNTLNIKPINFLIGEVVDYKITTKEINTHGGKGYTITFPLNHYHLKLYDKGLQCGLEWNALKFEIRVKKMVYIKGAGVSSLYDLSDQLKWEWFKRRLIKNFEDILICDYIKGVELTDEEKLLYRTCVNQQFWIKNWPNSLKYEKGAKDINYIEFRKIYFKQRADFINLIKKNGFDANKNYLLARISVELDSLIAS